MIPQSRSPVFLVTRPEPQAAGLLAVLARRYCGAAIVHSPLMVPDFLHPPLPESPFSAVIFTSQVGVMAVRGLGPLPPRAYCVGDRTAMAAGQAGFATVSAGGTAEDLIAAIMAAGEAGPLLHLRGVHGRGDVAARLTAAGVPVQALTVYEQRARPLSPEAADCLLGTDPVIVPLFSPRSAALFVHEARRIGAVAPLFCPVLGPAVAASIPETTGWRVFLANNPDLEALTVAIKSAHAAATRS